MSMYKLKRSQLIKCDREEVFNFFKSPENLEKITPSNIGFNILTPRPINIHTGAVLDYTINLLGLKVRWTTQITDYNEPNGFVDVSIKGPYSFWYHQHEFLETKDGTVMNDEVTYSLPFGLLGRIVHKLWVKRQLYEIFNYRAEIIKNTFDSYIKYKNLSAKVK